MLLRTGGTRSIADLVATFGGVGRIPEVPGTFGTLAAVPLAYALALAGFAADVKPAALLFAATALGRAVELSGEERERGIVRYIGKFPYLEDFVRSPSCALFRVDVERYIVVTKFQNVIEVSPYP